ncbi:MAG: N-acetyl-gamma-glutamyl-phosphate reductase [Candidatus Parabeggiatoa sp. nov. 1]|nr:MAG: N-acetyl-gamma-glutamyl-phosphate reductase [Gammaproteobacteria bacterium]
MIKVGIVGGTGYTGVELLRLLVQHPQVQVQTVTSRAQAGTPITLMFPNLRGHLDLAFTDPASENFAHCDVVFFATPNGTAMQSARKLLEAGVKVIDLAADFRLKDTEVWEQWYGMTHACPELLDEAVYGLPEWNRAKIAKARLVANPGCYPTAVQLGFLPLLETKLIDPQHLIADAKSGVSGAGRKASVPTLMGEAGESFKAYNVSGHRHWPEICQSLNTYTEKPVGLTFVPHLVPMIRGIEATLYATLLRDATEDIQALFMQRYQDEPFVDVLPPKSHPETRNVRGVNMCQLAVHRPQDGNVVVILSVIDNLVKGAAGQAIQNMNIMCGLPETTGLTGVALLP